MKNTKQKSIILDIVNNSYEHLNAYQIYEIARAALPNISLGTVYRNLNNLVVNGMIKKINDDSDYEKFDRIDDHIHFVCNNCKYIYDIDKSYYDFSDNIQNHLVTSYEIILKGTCEKCKEKERK